MNARDRGLSAFFLVFLAFKVAEAGLRIESWPVSRVSMFAGYRPRQIVPLLSRLQATRDGVPVELTHHDFALTRDEFLARLHPDFGVAVRCGKLVESWNRSVAGPGGRIENAKIIVEPVSRPGLWNDFVGRTVTCAVSGDGANPAGKRP